MLIRRDLLASALAMASLSKPAFADPPVLKLAIGLHLDWEQIPSELGQQAGLFAKRSLRLDILATQGSGESLQAVVSRSVDIGVGLGTGGVMAAYSRGAPVRIIGSASTGSDDIYWYAKANSRIKTLQDVNESTTIGYSSAGSNSHLMLLALLKYHNVKAQPTRAGDLQSNFIQVMTGQIDMGVATPPMGIKELEEGQIRLIARGNEVPSMGDQTVRVLAVNLETLRQSPDVIARYVQGYRDSVDYMYSDPDALRRYRDLTGTPEDMMRKIMVEFYPKSSLDPDRVVGLEKIMEDAIAFKFLSKPLTPDQLKELVQIPAPIG